MLNTERKNKLISCGKPSNFFARVQEPRPFFEKRDQRGYTRGKGNGAET